MTKFILFIISVFLLASCTNTNKSQEGKEQNSVNDSIQIVKNPFKGDPSKIEFEIPILKGTKLRHGVQKRFYTNGCLYSQIPYTRNVRNGIAYTYYKAYGDTKPQVWKEQSYVNGKLDGVCKRYHADGKLQSEYKYKNGLREIGLKEFSKSGKPIKQPTLIVSKKSSGAYIQVSAKMSKSIKNVKYYTGTLVEGKYVSDNKKLISISKGVGKLSVSTDQKSVTIIAEMSTKYSNKYVTAKTISLK